MKEHAEECVELCREFVHKSVDLLSRVATLCTKDDFEILCALADVCAQLVFEGLYLAGIGPPDVF